MKKEIFVKLAIVSIFLFNTTTIFSIALGVDNQTNSSQNTLPENALNISPEVREVITGPWKQDSFDKSMRLMADSKQSVDSRQSLMAKLANKRRQLNTAERTQFLYETSKIAKDTNESPKLRGMAIREMARTSLFMYETGEITKEQARSEKQFLIETIRDKQLEVQQRCSAINAIKTLNITEANETLENLLVDPNDLKNAEIVKSACLALVRIAGNESFIAICRIHAETDDPNVFNTSAYCLGQIKTPKSVATLISNDKRFPDVGTATFTIVDMEEVIYDTLSNPNNTDLISAIDATEHLWRPGQKEQYMPLLYDLLQSATLDIRKSAVERLLNESQKLSFDDEKLELSKILNIIEEQLDLVDYADYIKQKLSAKKIVPQISNMPVPNI